MEITYWTALTAAQFVVIWYFAYKALRVVQLYLLYSSDLSAYKPKTGEPWALVTGASDGIGKAFTQELCRRGFNVIMHGRNEKKLKGVKAQVQKEFPNSEIRLLVLDAAKTAWIEETDASVLAVVKDLKLTVLINNLGGLGGIKPDFGPINQRAAWELDAWINVNLRFMTQLTRVLIPILSKDKSQRSAIANISSAAELVPCPYLVTYSATKAYVSRWSLSLESELRTALGLSVDVHSIIVGAVATANSGMDDSMASLFTPTPNVMASATLQKLGCSQVVCTPYWPHGLQVGFIGSLPSWIGARMMLDNLTKQMARTEKKQ